MSRDTDRIPQEIACLETQRMPAVLMSLTGYHCEVWQTRGRLVRDGQQIGLDLIIKCHKDPCTLAEVQLLNADYRRLRERLGEIVPRATFVATRIDGALNVVVLAEVVRPWFNIANPNNEADAVPLLRRLTVARRQLATFVDAARAWHEAPEMRVIDLWGIDNLVLDRDQRVRYIDSFRVFFYADMLHLIADPGEDLEERIELSLRRLEYLEHLLQEAAPRD
ncbi:MAG: hypothetical protein DRR03_03015 [Gammaproteobacteria bacterium]|nr:MAG: hypothetical protein DRR03_03015 [Gammaproteobacteria bacterium]